MAMLTTAEIVKKYNLITKKSLGQNFLLHSDLVEKIAKCAGDLTNSEVLEVGTGPGGLTTAILKQQPQKLITLDMDERCIEIAHNEIKPYYDNLYPLLQDAIEFNENEYFKDKFKIIANLPYNIGTTLLFKWLENSIDKINTITLLLQKEVVERIIAKPNTKAYGRVSILCQYLCSVKKEFDIQPTAFLPPPKVVSSVIHLVPKKNIDLTIIGKLSNLAKILFNQRRKTINNNLKNSHYSNINEVLNKLNISENLRAENLNVEQFVLLAKELK